MARFGPELRQRLKPGLGPDDGPVMQKIAPPLPTPPARIDLDPGKGQQGRQHRQSDRHGPSPSDSGSQGKPPEAPNPRTRDLRRDYGWA